jgi:hypothetical protein
MEATQINYREGGTKKSVAQAIKDATELTPEQKADINKIPTIEAAVATKAAQSIIAPAFDAEAGTYVTGDLLMYDGGLYQFISDHGTAGDWDPTEVAEVKISEELSSLKSGLTELNSNLSTLKDNVEYTVTDVFTPASDLTLYATDPGTIVKRGNVVNFKLKFTGSATVGSKGFFTVGRITNSDLYNAIVENRASTYVNVSDTGERYVPAIIENGNTGYLYLIVDAAGQTIGNNTVSWTGNSLNFSFNL